MLNEIVRDYVKLFPPDEYNLSILLGQLKNNEKLNDRHNYTGHIAGSAIILSPDLTKILLVYHPTFDRWQQPGGHWEQEDEGPWVTAEREAVEETGVQIAEAIGAHGNKNVPLNIVSHLVPNNPSKKEPEHMHHDFQYGIIAKSEKVEINDDVIKKVQWFGLYKPQADLLRSQINRALYLHSLKA